jgi:hypothetical protein
MNVVAKRSGGSSELHAWGDSNLYLRRNGPHLNLSIEHRAAPGADRLQLTLKTNPPALALELMNQQPAESQPTQPSARLRIEQILAEAKTPLSQRQLRDAARIRTSHALNGSTHCCRSRHSIPRWVSHQPLSLGVTSGGRSASRVSAFLGPLCCRRSRRTA